MLRLTIYTPQSLTTPIKIDKKGEIILSQKLTGEPYFNLLNDLCRFDVAINNSKKEADSALYLVPSNDNASFIVDRRGNFIRIPLETHLQRFNLTYPAVVESEVIFYRGIPVLKLHTTKIATGKSVTPKELSRKSDEQDPTEDDLMEAGISKKLAKDILKNKKAKEVPKKTSPSKRNPQSAKNDTLFIRGKKAPKTPKAGTKNKIVKN